MPAPVGGGVAPLPRLSTTELTERHDFSGPFILTGNMTHGWGATERVGDRLVELFPQAVVEHGNLLMKLKHAIEAGAADERYLLLQLPPPRWNVLERSNMLPPPQGLPSSAVSHFIAAQHPQWWAECLDDSTLAFEWHMKTHWSQLLSGNRGAGMSNHTDALLVGAWHAHVAGRKRWTLCGASAGCFEGVVEAGEVLFYGAGWAHETMCLATPTVSVSRSVVQRAHAKALIEQISNECAFGSVANLGLSGALCDAWERLCAPRLLRQLGLNDTAAEEIAADVPSAWRERIRHASAARAAAGGDADAPRRRERGRGSGGEMAARRAIRRREEVQPEHHTYEAYRPQAASGAVEREPVMNTLSLQLNRDFYEAQGVELDSEVSVAASSSTDATSQQPMMAGSASGEQLQQANSCADTSTVGQDYSSRSTSLGSVGSIGA